MRRLKYLNLIIAAFFLSLSTPVYPCEENGNLRPLSKREAPGRGAVRQVSRPTTLGVERTPTPVTPSVDLSAVLNPDGKPKPEATARQWRLLIVGVTDLGALTRLEWALKQKSLDLHPLIKGSLQKAIDEQKAAALRNPDTLLRMADQGITTAGTEEALNDFLAKLLPDIEALNDPEVAGKILALLRRKQEDLRKQQGAAEDTANAQI